jgi:glycosyltransferase 2 family protein
MARSFPWLVFGTLCLIVLIVESGLARISSDLGLIGSELLVVIALEFIVDGFNTLGWWFTFPAEKRAGAFPRLFFVRLAGTALNSLLPAASMGGEPAKVYLLTGAFEVSTVIATVMASSFIFSLSKAVFIIAGTLLTFWRLQLSQGAPLVLLAGFVLTLGALTVFLGLQLRGFTGLAGRVLGCLPIPDKWAAIVSRVMPDIDAEIGALYRSRPRDVVLAICAHQAAFLCGVLQVLLLLGRLGLPRSIHSSVAIESFAMLIGFVAFMVPGELGVQEGGKLIIFRVLGLPAAAGVTVGLAFRLTSLVGAAAGLMSFMALKVNKRQVQASKSLLPHNLIVR